MEIAIAIPIVQQPGRLRRRTRERLAIELPDPIPLEMLPFVIQGESDGDAWYQRWADNESDPDVERLLRLNGREESLHGRRVTQVMAILERSADS